MKQFPDVDAYIEHAERWPEEIAELRTILLGCGLSESIKWGKPCYDHGGNNIVIVQEMKDFLALLFFKGALLEDPAGVLEDQGPNSRAARRMCFRSVGDVRARAGTIETYVAAAVAAEEAGLEVAPPPELVLVDELQRRLDENPRLRAAFDALTPGRRREYNLYFSDAKKAETREARIDRYVEKILAGKGFRDR